MEEIEVEEMKEVEEMEQVGEMEGENMEEM